MYVTALLIEHPAVGKHYLDVLSPVPHIQVLRLLHLFLDGGQVHGVDDVAQVVVECLLAAEVFRGHRVEEGLRFLMVPYVSSDIPELLDPLCLELDFSEFIVNTGIFIPKHCLVLVSVPLAPFLFLISI
jgi:hypothetical protein